MIEAAIDEGRPFLGICVRHAVMASMGREYEDTAGLDCMEGEVTKINAARPLFEGGRTWAGID